ncbi:MAG TPA: ROK family protein [Vicinamibacterales bacterium]|nr:ROK family protein [Vicinamibacterales bacterium]
MTLGLDLSDGTARAVIVNEHAQVLARGEHLLAAGQTAAAAAAAVRRAVAGAGVTVERAAVALPQPGDVVPGDLDAALRDLLPGSAAPATVASGVAAVVAEHWCGAARGLTTVVALSAGEHVTCGIILDGKPWTGTYGMAGSVGWLSLNPVEREDYRRLGGLEAEVSARGIVRRIVWRIKSGDTSVVSQRHGGDLSRITAADVFQGARGGDGLCVSVIRDTARYIGMALSNLAATLDPQAIVLGGVIASSGDVLLESIRLECGRRLPHAQAERLRIVLSPLGSDAAAIGAARMTSLSP